jgi:uncharacterized protein YcfJ
MQRSHEKRAAQRRKKMNMLTCLRPATIGAALAVAIPAAAQTGFSDDAFGDARYDYAHVVKVDAIVSHDSRPVSRETCWQEPTTTYRPTPAYTYYKDDDDDDGPDVVTVESAYRPVTATHERCRTETDWRNTNRVLGYDVTYRYHGREYTTHMDHDPGDRLRVRVNYDYTITPSE